MKVHKFGSTSKGRLSTCNDDIQIIFNTAISLCRVDFGIAEGERSVERQFELYKKGRKEVDGKWVIVNKHKKVTNIDGINKKGKHNYCPSEAIDIYGWVNGKATWDRDTLIYLTAFIVGVSEILYKEGKIYHKLRSGLNWDMDGEILTDQSFDDLPHLEIYKP